MRKRINENDEIIQYIQLPFEIIPDDYKIMPVLTDGLNDYTYVGIFKTLRDKQKNGEKMDINFQNNNLYAKEVLSYMAMDYLESAIYLSEAIYHERASKEIICSAYVIPCAYCCKHAIELKLKHCLLVQDGQLYHNKHSCLFLWDKINKSPIPNYDDLTFFINEVEKIDKNEMALRYGINNQLVPLSETFRFNVISMVQNAMFLFNILEEYVIYYCLEKNISK